MIHRTADTLLCFEVLDRTTSFDGARFFEGALVPACELLVDRPHFLQVLTTTLCRRLFLAAVCAESVIEGILHLFTIQLALHD